MARYDQQTSLANAVPDYVIKTFYDSAMAVRQSRGESLSILYSSIVYKTGIRSETLRKHMHHALSA